MKKNKKNKLRILKIKTLPPSASEEIFRVQNEILSDFNNKTYKKEKLNDDPRFGEIRADLEEQVISAKRLAEDFQRGSDLRDATIRTEIDQKVGSATRELSESLRTLGDREKFLTGDVDGLKSETGSAKSRLLTVETTMQEVILDLKRLVWMVDQISQPQGTTRLDILLNGNDLGTIFNNINLIAGSGISITSSLNTTNRWVDLTISSTSTGNPPGGNIYDIQYNDGSGGFAGTDNATVDASGNAYLAGKAAIGISTPLYEVDIYDNAGTGFDIGNSTNFNAGLPYGYGGWNISSGGLASLSGIYILNPSSFSGGSTSSILPNQYDKGQVISGQSWFSYGGGQTNDPQPGVVAVSKFMQDIGDTGYGGYSGGAWGVANDYGTATTWAGYFNNFSTSSGYRYGIATSGTEQGNYFGAPTGFGVSSQQPTFAVDIYDAFGTGYDIGNSTTGLWGIGSDSNFIFQSGNFYSSTDGTGNYLNLNAPGTYYQLNFENSSTGEGWHVGPYWLGSNSPFSFYNTTYGGYVLNAFDNGDFVIANPFDDSNDYNPGKKLQVYGPVWLDSGLITSDGSGHMTAASFATSGGSSLQFVKADGSLDGSTYLSYTTSGSATLVSGTKAITISGLTTSNKAFVTIAVTGGTLGVTYKAVCTTNTLTITSVSAAGTTVTTDTSTLNYLVL